MMFEVDAIPLQRQQLPLLMPVSRARMIKGCISRLRHEPAAWMRDCVSALDNLLTPDGGVRLILMALKMLELASHLISNLGCVFYDAELPVKTAGLYFSQPLIPICSHVCSRQNRQRLFSPIRPHQQPDDNRLNRGLSFECCDFVQVDLKNLYKVCRLVLLDRNAGCLSLRL